MARASYERRERRLKKKAQRKNLQEAVKAGKVRLVPKAELVRRMEKAQDKVNFVAR